MPVCHDFVAANGEFSSQLVLLTVLYFPASTPQPLGPQLSEISAADSLHHGSEPRSPTKLARSFSWGHPNTEEEEEEVIVLIRIIARNAGLLTEDNTEPK